MSMRFELGRDSHVIEVASNDGYLLKNFVRQGMRVLGVEPAGNVAKVAIEAGVPTMISFFGRETARRIVGNGVRADLMVANTSWHTFPISMISSAALKFCSRRKVSSRSNSRTF